MITFAEIVKRYFQALGLEPYVCQSEDEARARVEELWKQGKWPCFFFESDTTGEKGFEEFYTQDQVLDMDRFENIGVIKNEPEGDGWQQEAFVKAIQDMQHRGEWSKQEMVELFCSILQEFTHLETGKYLDGRM